ncbi:MAG: hypothetical protein KDC84_16340, partial [Crocinitomicaceae bacterium]|nr:hypothetical protein [Crocinitomicaceae bacterium]
MRALLNSQILSVVGLAIMLTLSSSSFAQHTSNPDSISQEPPQWNLEEREVPIGGKILELPEGSPIAAFSSGGAKEKILED